MKDVKPFAPTRYISFPKKTVFSCPDDISGNCALLLFDFNEDNEDELIIVTLSGHILVYHIVLDNYDKIDNSEYFNLEWSSKLNVKCIDENVNSDKLFCLCAFNIPGEPLVIVLSSLGDAFLVRYTDGTLCADLCTTKLCSNSKTCMALNYNDQRYLVVITSEQQLFVYELVILEDGRFVVEKVNEFKFDFHVDNLTLGPLSKQCVLISYLSKFAEIRFERLFTKHGNCNNGNVITQPSDLFDSIISVENGDEKGCSLVCGLLAVEAPLKPGDNNTTATGNDKTTGGGDGYYALCLRNGQMMFRQSSPPCPFVAGFATHHQWVGITKVDLFRDGIEEVVATAWSGAVLVTSPKSNNIVRFHVNESVRAVAASPTALVFATFAKTVHVYSSIHIEIKRPVPLSYSEELAPFFADSSKSRADIVTELRNMIYSNSS